MGMTGHDSPIKITLTPEQYSLTSFIHYDERQLNISHTLDSTFSNDTGESTLLSGHPSAVNLTEKHSRMTWVSA